MQEILALLELELIVSVQCLSDQDLCGQDKQNYKQLPEPDTMIKILKLLKNKCLIVLCYTELEMSVRLLVLFYTYLVTMLVMLMDRIL